MKIQEALLACLPPAAYDRQALPVRQLMQANADVMDIAVTGSDAMLAEQQPDLAAQMLLDWERNHALPDACIGGASATLTQRVNNLLARIRAKGDLSRNYMISIAATMGYPGCTITELGGMTCADPCTDPLNSPDFIGTWRLNVPVSTAITEMTCTSPCDSPLRSWGNTQLECAVNRRKPAHTRALFAYAI